MQIEKVILVLAWLAMVLALYLFIPRNKVREAHLAFLFMQVITWSTGLLIVELRLVEFPVREFYAASQSSFTFDFFVYPAISAIFNVYYPEKKSGLIKFGYYGLFCSGISGVELLLEHYTALIKYINWGWYWTWLSVFISFFISRVYFRWFFRMNGRRSYN